MLKNQSAEQNLEPVWYKHQLVLTEPLPWKDVAPWLSGKARGDSHGKQIPYIMLYGMNFLTRFTPYLYQLMEQCMAFLFFSLEKNMKGALETQGRGNASSKKHFVQYGKNKTSFFLTSAKSRMKRHIKPSKKCTHFSLELERPTQFTK